MTHDEDHQSPSSPPQDSWIYVAEVVSGILILVFGVLYLRDYVYGGVTHGTFETGYLLDATETGWIRVFISLSLLSALTNRRFGLRLLRLSPLFASAVAGMLLALELPAVRAQAVRLYLDVLDPEVPAPCLTRPRCALGPGVARVLLGDPIRRAQLLERLPEIQQNSDGEAYLHYVLSRAEGVSALEYATDDWQALERYVRAVRYEHTLDTPSGPRLRAVLGEPAPAEGETHLLPEGEVRAVLNAVTAPGSSFTVTLPDLVRMRVVLQRLPDRPSSRALDRQIVEGIRARYEALSGSPRADFLATLARAARSGSTPAGEVAFTVIAPKPAATADHPPAPAPLIHLHLSQTLALLGYHAVPGTALTVEASLSTLTVREPVSVFETHRSTDWKYKRGGQTGAADFVLTESEDRTLKEIDARIRLPVLDLRLFANRDEHAFRLLPVLSAGAQRLEDGAPSDTGFETTIDLVTGPDCDTYDLPCLDAHLRTLFGVGALIDTQTVQTLPPYGG